MPGAAVRRPASCCPAGASSLMWATRCASAAAARSWSAAPLGPMATVRCGCRRWRSVGGTAALTHPHWPARPTPLRHAPPAEPVAVSNIHPQMDADPEDVEDINARLLYLEVGQCRSLQGEQPAFRSSQRAGAAGSGAAGVQAAAPAPALGACRLPTWLPPASPPAPPSQDAPADLPVWIPLPQWVKVSGTRASEAQRAAALAGEVLEGRIVMWGNRAFESASNRGVTAQQQDVRQEVRADGGAWSGRGGLQAGCVVRAACLPLPQQRRSSQCPALPLRTAAVRLLPAPCRCAR